jgi:hypothetical protein
MSTSATISSAMTIHAATSFGTSAFRRRTCGTRAGEGGAAAGGGGCGTTGRGAGDITWTTAALSVDGWRSS